MTFPLPKVRVAAFSVSIDAFAAGPRQSLEAPLGVGGEQLHEWVVTTRTFARMSGSEGGSTGTDDRFAARSFDNVGAWIHLQGRPRVVGQHEHGHGKAARPSTS